LPDDANRGLTNASEKLIGIGYLLPVCGLARVTHFEPHRSMACSTAPNRP